MIQQLFFEGISLMLSSISTAGDSLHFFNVFKYLTFRTIYAVITALVVSFLLGPWMIRKLEALQAKQVIRTDGPESHLKKQGTPTMGGLLILASVIIPTLLWADLANTYVWLALFIIGGFGLIGFVDDYRKIVKKNTKGLSPRQKILLQAFLGALVGLFLVNVPGFSTELTVLFSKTSIWI
jgi:phospho-N-acetylmuramoyl-pentapeptide-transferase